MTESLSDRSMKQAAVLARSSYQHALTSSHVPHIHSLTFHLQLRYHGNTNDSATPVGRRPLSTAAVSGGRSNDGKKCGVNERQENETKGEEERNKIPGP
jgi:hypothetical protein